MDVDFDSIDFDKLEKELEKHFLGIMFNVSPAASTGLTELEKATSDYELYQIALREGIDLTNCLKDDTYYKRY